MSTLAASPPLSKRDGWSLYREVFKSPKFVVAPMVEQSELAWRVLSRRYGAEVCYTPMINTKMYASREHSKTYRESNFNTVLGEEGKEGFDRPLVIQFCGNDPEDFLVAAKALEPYCDAVDINLGCPQEIARRGRYGSFLQDEWELVGKIIRTLHENLTVPVTAKFRVFPSVERTVEYAKMLEASGAQILTVHGRTREQRGTLSGLADWSKIRAVKEAVNVPVFANGNILYWDDVVRCLEETGADAVMSAEGNLYNPAISAPLLLAEEHVPHHRLAAEYLDIIRSLATPTEFSSVKGHLFKLLRPAFALPANYDLRNKLGVPNKKGTTNLEWFENIVEEMGTRMEADMVDPEATIEQNGSVRRVPHWLSQPYFRPLPPKPTEQTSDATPS